MFYVTLKLNIFKYSQLSCPSKLILSMDTYNTFNTGNQEDQNVNDKSIIKETEIKHLSLLCTSFCHICSQQTFPVTPLVTFDIEGPQISIISLWFWCLFLNTLILNNFFTCILLPYLVHWHYNLSCFACCLFLYEVWSCNLTKINPFCKSIV